MGATYDKQFLSPRSAVGRNRQPFNLPGEFGTAATASDGGATIASADMNTAKITGSYSTHNVRYLHLALNTVTGAKDVTVTTWGFNYAFGRWFPLQDTGGNAVQLQSTNTYVQRSFEIAGVDRVWFQSTGNEGLIPTNFFYAGGSTF